MFYEARYYVDWGYGWACPGYHDENSAVKQCMSTVTTCESEVCASHLCKGGEKQLVRKEESICAYGYSGLEAFDSQEDNANEIGLSVSLTGFREYNPLVGPSQDVDWASIIVFGDL